MRGEESRTKGRECCSEVEKTMGGTEAGLRSGPVKGVTAMADHGVLGDP